MAEPQKFPEVHHPPRGEQVKLLDWNEVWQCPQDSTSRLVAHSLTLDSLTCPQCEGPMECVEVRDNGQNRFEP